MYEKGNSFSQIAKKLGIPSKNVIRWCRNGTQRKPGAGRKVLDP
jgi:transposase-like protein